MLSASTPKLHATDLTAARSSSAIDTPSQNASSAHNTADLPILNLPKAPARHYTTLQEHADQMLETDSLGQAGGTTPRHTSRREGFTWGQQLDVEKRRQNQYAMTPELERPSSPPPLEEILRNSYINDADDIQNHKLRHVDSMESQSQSQSPSPTALHLFETLSASGSDYNPQRHRRSSIVAFAKGIVRHVPDFRILHPQDNKQDWQRRDSKQDCIPSLQKKDSSLYFEPPPFPDSRNSPGQLSKPAIVVDEPSKGDDKSISLSNSPPPAASSGLRARRKIHLDLTMPSQTPDLPARSRHPVDIAGNLAAPRSGSPKTPWMRNEQPKREPDQMGKSSPIKEEDYMEDNSTGLSNGDRGGSGLLPSNDILHSLQLPKSEQSQANIANEYHRFHTLSNKPSGQTDHSAATAGDLGVAQTLEGGLAPAKERLRAQTTEDLRQLAQNSKKSRSRWRRWRFTTSSEDATPPSGSEPSKYRLPINPFKRSNRLSDQAILEIPRQKGGLTHSTHRSTQYQYPSLSLAHISTPPTFIPPGLNRVPTPPLHDTNDDVKGKLADFYFDLQSSDVTGHRKRPQASSEGYWDSDALLMSLSTDLTNFGDEEDEEEGPEGPQRNTIQSRQTFGRSGSLKLFGQRSQGFQGIRPPLSPSLAADSPMLGHDGWYRVNHEHGANLRDQRTIEELRRQEEEERRKFEWLVPEHLPNSPLCPLHTKYEGPSKGLCYWHGRRSGVEIRRGEYTRPEAWDGGGGGRDYMGAGSGSPGIVTPQAKEMKKRRLVSLSSP